MLLGAFRVGPVVLQLEDLRRTGRGETQEIMEVGTLYTTNKTLAAIISIIRRKIATQANPILLLGRVSCMQSTSDRLGEKYWPVGNLSAVGQARGAHGLGLSKIKRVFCYSFS